MKTLLITLCKNEMDILPFVTKYWERLNCDVLVYDNYSDDGSDELIKNLPYATLRYFKTDGHNDLIHKQIKENAYIEFKDKYDIIIISDMDELFCFNDFKSVSEAFINSDCNILMTPIISLCEQNKPRYLEDRLLHQQCHMFFKQRMNHMKGFDDYSKLSIFNTKLTDEIKMSVGQHYVYAKPYQKIALTNEGFCLHINKGFGVDYYVGRCRKMGANLSKENINGGMGIEYLNSTELLKREYLKNQANSFDINQINMFI